MPDLAEQLQELKERFGAEDFVVEELDDDDPILRSVDGRIIDTWRESYPYQERMSATEYEGEKRLLQIELLKMQNWIKEQGRRHGDPVRGPRRRRQGRHDQAVHGAPQPAARPRRRPGEADQP